MEDREVPTLIEIERKIKRIDNLRDKALISFLYLSGARVSEVVMKLKVKDIKIEKQEDRLFYIFHIYTEKRREKMDVYRRVGIPFDNNQVFLDIIINYINKHQLNNSDYLFDIHRRTAYRIVKKHFGFNPHFLRHTRVTHLTTMYGLNAQELLQYIGWSDIRTASVYTHLNWKDVSRKL